MLKLGKNLKDFDRSPSIMEPIDNIPAFSPILGMSKPTMNITPDILLNNEMESLNITAHVYGEEENHAKSFLLMDGNETLKIPTAEAFCQKLSCSMDSKIKVVSIFGNTGDGKSHTMNHTFFEGEEIFRTSPEQNSCTMGVWAAFQPSNGVIALDTEGLLGVTTNENRRTRMLLKVLAISDIVIYRTNSERLHSDMFSFLGTASKAFVRHFSQALQSLGLPGPPQALGPSVIIFHETSNTKTLISTVDKSTEDILRERFAETQMDLEAFSSLRYSGIQTREGPTNFTMLRDIIRLEIENTTVRSPRQPEVVFKAIMALNKKFSGDITDRPVNPFPEQYFTCGVCCEACGERCERSMGHVVQKEDHCNSKPCRYQHQFENKVYLCKQCHVNGRQIIVKIRTQSSNDTSWYGLAKYAWSGSVIECPNCGEIYRSRQYWYGNKLPEQCAVSRIEIVHVWKDGKFTPKGPTHSAQLVLDSVTYLTDAVASVGAQPTKTITSWVTDKMAPTYWKPNSDIVHCHLCKVNFDRSGLRKHHCRSCGDGFCNACSKHEMPVPNRCWYTPVRVCNICRDELIKTNENASKVSNDMTQSNGNPEEEANVRVRKYGEAVINTLSNLTAVLEYPKDLIKDSARPSYWVPDAEAPNCVLCNLPFGTAEELNPSLSTSPSNNDEVNSNVKIIKSSPIHVADRKRHHCRACGQAVCGSCSFNRRPVPERGWNIDVRVCDSCIMDTE